MLLCAEVAYVYYVVGDVTCTDIFRSLLARPPPYFEHTQMSLVVH
jgi:hypothetical protein